MSTDSAELNWRRDFWIILVCLGFPYIIIGGFKLLDDMLPTLYEISSVKIFTWFVCIFGFAGFLSFNFKLLFLKFTKEKTVLDYGTNESEDADPVIFFNIIIVGLGALIFSFTILSDLSNILVFLFWCSYAIYLIELNRGRLLFREDGIWDRTSWIKWNKIKSYHWKNEPRLQLVIETNNRFLDWGQTVLPVAQKHQPIIEELLQKHTLFASQSESTTSIQAGDVDGC